MPDVTLKLSGILNVCFWSYTQRQKENSASKESGPPFIPAKSPKGDYAGSLLCVLSQEMRHIDFVGGGGQKVNAERTYPFLRPLFGKDWLLHQRQPRVKQGA